MILIEIGSEAGVFGKAAKGERAESRLAQGPASVILETLLFWTVGCTYIWNDCEVQNCLFLQIPCQCLIR